MSGGSRPSVLLVANDLFYPFVHRIQHVASALKQEMPVRAVSLAPPGVGLDGTTIPRRAFLKGWARRVILERQPLRWQLDGTQVVRRFPLPSALGPLANLASLVGVLKRVDHEITLAQGPVPARACLARGIPFLYDHADDYGGGRVDWLHQRILERWQSQALRRAQAVACAGPSLLRHARESGAREAELLPNGVVTSFFGIPRCEAPVPTAVFLGALERDHGVDLVVRAMPLVPPEARLVVAGTGPWFRRLAALAKKLGVDSRVTFTGAVPRDEVPRILASAWVGVALFADSRWNRAAFHLKILEYMAAGLPFLTSPVGDAAEMARSTGAGIVVDWDEKAVSEALGMLLGDAALRQRLSSRGRTAAAEYDWSVIGPRYARWVTQVAGLVA